MIAALLRLSRRTTLLGALILMGVLLDVVPLNSCYDGPVKINSTHYFAIMLYLVLPSVGRLANVILFSRPPQATGVIEMRYTRIDDNHHELARRVGTHDLTVRLERDAGRGPCS